MEWAQAGSCDHGVNPGSGRRCWTFPLFATSSRVQKGSFRWHETKAQPAVGMRGFGHDTGNEVFTLSHDSRDQDWVAKFTRVDRVGPSRPGGQVLRSSTSEDSDSNLKGGPQAASAADCQKLEASDRGSGA